MKQIGTLFMLSDCIDYVINKHTNLALGDRPISIVGSGYSGRILATFLESRGFKINMFDVLNQDIFPSSTNIKFMHNRFRRVADSGLIILLTTKGDDGLKSIEQYLLPSMVLVSNTFPKVSNHHVKMLKRSGVHYYECSAFIDSIRMFPTYGQYGTFLFGGCFLQSFVESMTDKNYNDVEEFSIDARNLGLKGVVSTSIVSKGAL